MILTEEGYITMNATTPMYHYFLKDHLGTNRVVMNQSGSVEQVNHYYPFGGLFGEGLQDSNQSYKYNGKEFDNLLGLNMYDYGARHYDPYTGGWINVDPLTEKYYSISPYVYVVNNPVRFIDPDGREVLAVNIQARRNITNTLNRVEAQYVIFDDNGRLDIGLLNQYGSSSENFTALHALANSETNKQLKIMMREIHKIAILILSFALLSCSIIKKENIPFKLERQKLLSKEIEMQLPYSISPCVYVANNPVRFIDPTGMLIDDYFNRNGKYLGKDEFNTDFIRTMDQKLWNQIRYKNKYGAE